MGFATIARSSGNDELEAIGLAIRSTLDVGALHITEHAILIEGLAKDYGALRALHDVELQVHRGEVFGFIGPNGAGKSTTIRVLVDLLRPTQGFVEVLGVRELSAAPEVRARIGYLPGDLLMGGRQTAREHLLYLCSLRDGVGNDQIEPLAERFRLELDRPFRGLSKGNRQKVGVVQAFMHRPELLILDEPTSGLDPLLQQEFLSLVREAVAAGATAFVSSHILSEVEAIADRVAIIRAGRIIEVEEVHKLRDRAGQLVALTFEAELPAETLAALEALDELEHLEVSERTLSGVLRGSPDRLLKIASQHTVTSWHAEDRNLEALFMDHYRALDGEETP